MSQSTSTDGRAHAAGSHLVAPRGAAVGRAVQAAALRDGEQQLERRAEPLQLLDRRVEPRLAHRHARVAALGQRPRLAHCQHRTQQPPQHSCLCALSVCLFVCCCSSGFDFAVRRNFFASVSE